MSEINHRITRIEESQAFTERSLEQLDEELLRAFKTIDGLSKRIDRLEGRLSTMEQADSEEGESTETP